MIQYQTDYVVNAVAIAVVTTAEIVVAAGNPIYSAVPSGAPLGNARARVRGNVVITPGTAAVAIVINVYRGATKSGTLIGTMTIFCVATDPIGAVIDAVDPFPGALAQYCMSVTQTSASGNGSVTLSALQTDILA